MTALNRKLLRDLMQMKGQTFAICVVMACGVATFVMSLTMLASLEQSKDVYYSRYRFADVFAQVKRAPESLREEIAAIPGVAVVQTRIVQDVTLDVPDMAEPAVARMISLPERSRPILNDIHLREGRYIEPGHAAEVIVNEAFAQAHNLHPGDSVTAILNQRLQTLQIVGVAISPEYVLTIRGLDALPDNRRFGVFWMGYEELANAFDMDDAFNDITIKLLPGANEQEVIRELDRLTDRYGAIGSYGRDDQISNRFLSDEIRSLRGMGLILPIIFLGVAGFLLNVVMTRLIGTQREQVAALKAFGYSRWEVGAHYLKFVLVIAFIGSALGVAAGLWLARGLTVLYAQFYHFPEYVFRPDTSIFFYALATAAGSAVLGTFRAVHRAVKLPAAEAMRPEPPATYRASVVERLAIQRLFTQPARMVLRHLERQPIKAAMSVLGISMAVAVLILGSFVTDAIDYMIQFGFYVQQRQDVTVSFVEPASSSALHEVSRFPGVLHAEPMRAVPVRLHAGSLSRRTSITGLEPNATLFRVIDEDMMQVHLPPEGIVVSEKLAEVLGVNVGDELWVQVMEGRRGLYRVTLAATVREYAGTNAYMDIDALRRLVQEGDTISAVFLSVDESQMDDLYHQLKRTPRVAAVSVKDASVQSFNETQAQNQRQIQFFNVIFACAIAAGVVYNTARISFSEHSRELATLRVIGFTRGEISAILLGELAVLTLLALPVGMVCGYLLSAWIVAAVESESFRLPVVISRSTYGFAALVVIISAVVSGMIVRRRLDHLDLVSVLKSKE